MNIQINKDKDKAFIPYTISITVETKSDENNLLHDLHSDCLVGYALDIIKLIKKQQ